MRFFSKVVTALLLITLGAVALFAAIPCQEQAKSSSCCKAQCPMMAAKDKNGDQPRIQSVRSTQCGCQVSPKAPASIPIAPSQREAREMALVHYALADFVPVVLFRAGEDYIPPYRESHRHSQSVLCIFQV
jgi:hypothetical protein